jgi:hypothetical protein
VREISANLVRTELALISDIDARARRWPEDLTMTVTRLILLAMAVFVVMFAARFFLSSRK